MVYQAYGEYPRTTPVKMETTADNVKQAIKNFHGQLLKQWPRFKALNADITDIKVINR